MIMSGFFRIIHWPENSCYHFWPWMIPESYSHHSSDAVRSRYNLSDHKMLKLEMPGCSFLLLVFWWKHPARRFKISWLVGFHWKHPFFGASIIVTGYMQMKICVAEESWRSRRVSLGHCASAFVHTTSTWSMSLPTPLGCVRDTWSISQWSLQNSTFLSTENWFVRKIGTRSSTKSGCLGFHPNLDLWSRLVKFYAFQLCGHSWFARLWLLNHRFRMSEVRQSFQVGIRAKNSW